MGIVSGLHYKNDMQNAKQFQEKVGGHRSGMGNCTWDQEAGRRARLEKALYFKQQTSVWFGPGLPVSHVTARKQRGKCVRRQ